MPDWRSKDHPRVQTSCVSFGLFLALTVLVDQYTSRHVIHAVGPVYTVRGKEEKATQLTSCYKTSLDLAAENGIRHIVSMDLFLFHWAYICTLKFQAFPSISTGIYSYPIVDATRIALNTARVFLDSEQGNKVRVAFTRLRFSNSLECSHSCLYYSLKELYLWSGATRIKLYMST